MNISKNISSTNINNVQSITDIQSRNRISNRDITISKTKPLNTGNREIVESNFYMTLRMRDVPYNEENVTKKNHYEKFGKLTSTFFDSMKSGKGIQDTTILEDMTSMYSEIKTQIEEKYAGDELEKQLKWLDDAYSVSTEEDLAKSISIELYMAQSQDYGAIRMRNMFIDAGYTHLEGKALGKRVEINLEATRFLIKNITSSVNNLVKKAKQYFFEGNEKPKKDEEKNNFSKYISEGTNGNLDGLSYDGLKTVMSSLGIIQNGDKDDLNNISEEIKNSSLSNDVKDLMSAVTRQRFSNLRSSATTDSAKNIESKLANLIIEREKNKMEHKNNSLLSSEEKYKSVIEQANKNSSLEESINQVTNEIMNHYEKYLS